MASRVEQPDFVGFENVIKNPLTNLNQSFKIAIIKEKHLHKDGIVGVVEMASPVENQLVPITIKSVLKIGEDF